MKKFLNIILFFLILATLSCAKKTEKFQEVEPKKTFGVSQTDVELDLNNKIIGLQPHSVDLTSTVIDSEEIINLAALFLRSDFNDLKLKASSIYNQSFVPNVSSTYLTSSAIPAGSPYVEQAYLFLKPFLISQYSHILQKTQSRVEVTANKITRPIETNLSSKSYIDFIVKQLKEFNINLLALSEQDTSNFINPVTKKITEEYIKPLQEFSLQVNWVKDRKLSVFLNQLHEAVGVVPGLTDYEKKISKLQLLEAFEYAKQNDEIKDGYSAFNLIIDMWINKAQRQRSPKLLQEVFKKYNDKQLLALVLNNQPAMDPASWDKLKNRKDFDKMTDKELVVLAAANSELLKGEEWLSTINSFNLAFVNHADLKDILISRGVNNEQSEGTKLTALVSYWLNLKIRFLFPENLVAKLSEFNSDKDLEKLKDNNWWNYSILRSRVIDNIESFQNAEGKKANSPEEGIDNFKNFIAQKVYVTVETIMRHKTLQLALNLKFMLRDEVITQLEAQKVSFPKLVFDDFGKYAGRYVKEWFFKQKSQLNIFEAQRVGFKKTGLQWFPAEATLEQTSSSLIGESLMFSLAVLKSDMNLEEKNKHAFKIVNTLSALSGYIDYNLELTDSFMMPLLGNTTKKFNIKDIQNYNPLETTFAVPDRVYLNQQFKINTLKSYDNAQVSVSGQMKLLKSYTKLMEWFKTWNKSSFDETLSPLRLSEFPSQEIFPKKELFKQSLALALSILKNVSAKMAGLIDQNGRFVEGLKIEKPRGAVVHGFNNKNEIIKIVKTKDIAESLISISDFIITTEDITSFEDQDIKAAMPQIQAARSQLKSLLLGLALFSTTKLSQHDQGYVVGYNLETQTPIKQKRQLADQLSMQRAFIKVSQVLKSDLLKLKAIENYFFINSNFWNKKIGFYNSIEGAEGQSSLKIAHLLEALETVRLIALALSDFAPHDNNAQKSLAQTMRLQQYWNSRLLSGINRAQSVVELVGDQAPAFSP